MLNQELRNLIASGVNKYNRANSQRTKPKEGVNRYRILAPSRAEAAWVRPSGQFYADIGVHWIKADKNGKPLAVVGCHSIMNDQPCPVCTAIDLALANAVDQDSEELYKSWKPNKSVWVNAIDRSKGSATGEDPIVLELPMGVWGKVWDLAQQYADEGQWIFDADAGVDIAISKSGRGLNTEYQVNVAAGNNHKPVDKAVFGKLVNVFEMAQKEFFRGDEQKALNIITQVSGVALPRLGGPASNAALTGPRTKTAALTSPAAQVEDAEVIEMDDGNVAAVAPVKPAAPAQAQTVEASIDALSTDEVDDVLAELDNLS